VRRCTLLFVQFLSQINEALQHKFAPSAEIVVFILHGSSRPSGSLEQHNNVSLKVLLLYDDAGSGTSDIGMFQLHCYFVQAATFNSVYHWHFLCPEKWQPFPNCTSQEQVVWYVARGCICPQLAQRADLFLLCLNPWGHVAPQRSCIHCTII